MWRSRPFEGVSFAHTFSRWRRAASRHVTQYYEMMGCRAMYHDGWKAVAFHPLMLFVAYDGSDPRRPFDEDEWELYHVAEDFSETTDLAAKEPDKLAELIELWWAEAERNQVLPLTNMPGLPRRPAPPPRSLRVLRGHRLAARCSGAEPAQPLVADDGRHRQHQR